MAQRRSRNRRLSRRSDVPGILNENTNIIDNDDPTWYNRTGVRPSTEFQQTYRQDTVLDSDSIINSSVGTENWHKYIDQSDLTNQIIQKHKEPPENVIAAQKSIQTTDSNLTDESEKQQLKKRPKFQKRSQKRSRDYEVNNFTKVLTSNSVNQGDENEVTAKIRKSVGGSEKSINNFEMTTNSNKSMTAKIPLPPQRKFFRTRKQNRKSEENAFDGIFDNNSANESTLKEPELSESHSHFNSSSNSGLNDSNKNKRKEYPSQKNYSLRSKDQETLSDTLKDADITTKSNVSDKLNIVNKKQCLVELNKISILDTHNTIAKNSDQYISKENVSNSNSSNVGLNTMHIIRHSQDKDEQADVDVESLSPSEDVASLGNGEKNSETNKTKIGNKTHYKSMDMSMTRPISSKFQVRSFENINNEDYEQNLNVGNEANEEVEHEEEDMVSNETFNQNRKKSTLAARQQLSTISEGTKECSSLMTTQATVNAKLIGKNKTVENSTADSLRHQNSVRQEKHNSILQNRIPLNVSMDRMYKENLAIDQRIIDESLTSQITQKIQIKHHNDATKPEGEKNVPLENTNTPTIVDESFVSAPHQSLNKGTSTSSKRSQQEIHNSKKGSYGSKNYSTCNAYWLLTSSSEEDEPDPRKKFKKNSGDTPKTKVSKVSPNIKSVSVLQQSQRNISKSLATQSKIDEGNNEMSADMQEQEVIDGQDGNNIGTPNLSISNATTVKRNSQQEVINGQDGNNFGTPNLSISNATTVNRNSQAPSERSITYYSESSATNPDKTLNKTSKTSKSYTGKGSITSVPAEKKSQNNLSKTGSNGGSVDSISYCSESGEQGSSCSDNVQLEKRLQSTLLQGGRPINRLTEFSIGGGNIEEIPTPAIAKTVISPQKYAKNKSKSTIFNNNHDEGKASSGTQQKAPEENSGNRESDYEILIHRPDPDVNFTTKVNNEPQFKLDKNMFTKVNKRLESLKKRQLENIRLRNEERKEKEAAQAVNDRKLWAKIAAERKAAEKAKNKKPIDKAFLYKGKVYKQPKLPTPKEWVTKRLYGYLLKKLEPSYGTKARIQSEKFVKILSEVETFITKTKDYKKYRKDLDDLMQTMAAMDLIKTPADFYQFCRDFMPYSFRIKVIPMQLPGNIHNIPYEPDKLFKPIIGEEEESS